VNENSECRVLGPTCLQGGVFAAVSDVIQSALDGYHVCLFSYGQTGSGKTHTMNGETTCEHQRGIIPRAVTKILASAERLRSTGWQFQLEASFIEIYNESLRDLLGEEAPGRDGKQLESSCIKHNPQGHTEVCSAYEADILAGVTAYLARCYISCPSHWKVAAYVGKSMWPCHAGNAV
jgi:kinesin family member C1